MRVLIESGDAHERWGTVGVSHNVDRGELAGAGRQLDYKLYKDGKGATRRDAGARHGGGGRHARKPHVAPATAET